jgi:GT2 family glycosyltransferase
LYFYCIKLSRLRLYDRSVIFGIIKSMENPMENHQKKVVLVQLVFHAMKYIPQSFAAMVGQTYENKEIIALICGNDDGGKEYILKNFPSVKVLDYQENLKFVRGHNLIFSLVKDADYFQLVNQDLILEPNYVEEMVKVFEQGSSRGEKVGAANGKIYQYDFNTNTKLPKLDTTGVSIYKSGRGRSRGQHEVDAGQYDDQLDLISVDGAACMYSREALEAVKFDRALLGKASGIAQSGSHDVSSDGAYNREVAKLKNPQYEYFDIEFDMYCEDVDLGWRIFNAGFKCKFVPSAVGYHGRTAAASPGGYKRVFAFIKHHGAIASWIRKFNYKNHVFVVVKNSPKFYWQFFAREFFYNCFALVAETKTLGVLPLMFKQFPLMLKKRKFIQRNRKASVEEIEKLLI